MEWNAQRPDTQDRSENSNSLLKFDFYFLYLKNQHLSDSNIGNLPILRLERENSGVLWISTVEDELKSCTLKKTMLINHQENFFRIPNVELCFTVLILRNALG